MRELYPFRVNGNSMIPQLIDRLTTEQKRDLAQLDISPQRLSDWKHGRRRPTAAQAQTLALVAGTDPLQLLQWLAEQEATPAQRGLFRRVYQAAGANLALALTAVILSASIWPNSSFATTTYKGLPSLNDVHIVAHLWAKRGAHPGVPPDAQPLPKKHNGPDWGPFRESWQLGAGAAAVSQRYPPRLPTDRSHDRSRSVRPPHCRAWG